ncbi:MAG: hypothetical protein CL527_01115 [Aequorivita sp.]|nr:hypothetical protein [Aequorivita sp.]MAO47326.1 hypothetical protein [Aequorivita sp.]MBF30682.1 hypothetical protein [Aequorivita sp.]HBL79054.1 hypothetical protein [Aequorivita sp.]|tara:strand:+ start:42702 stop:43097 length:396 start_codon:yes stop_codon:yes gene_type:complete
MGMFHYYKFPESEVFIFDNFIVNQFEEGVTVTPEHNDKLRKVLDEHFANKKVVYISNRYFNYAVDPLTYLETSKIHKLIAIAIVAKTDLAKSNARLESMFYKKKFEVFDTLSEAMAWVQKELVNSEINEGS